MRKASVNQKLCVTCGSCVMVCKFGAISIYRGIYAVVDKDKCVGCRMCEKQCPAGIIKVEEVDSDGSSQTKKKVV